MLESFRELSKNTLAKNGRNVSYSLKRSRCIFTSHLSIYLTWGSALLIFQVDWVFLEVHAEGEPEHADLGHNAVTCLVPSEHEAILSQAMLDHDRDFAVFYNHLADLLEGKQIAYLNCMIGMHGSQ